MGYLPFSLSVLAYFQSDDQTGLTKMTWERERTHKRGPSIEEGSPDFLPKPNDNRVDSIRSRFAEVGLVELPEIPHEF